MISENKYRSLKGAGTHTVCFERQTYMYGEMQSHLIELIPLICISDNWGRYPVF